jgi:hypothetical protein
VQWAEVEMVAITLEDRGIVRVGGTEAAAFLHGLVTADIERLADGAIAFGALLTPQGKILFDFLVHRRGGDWLLDCAREAAPDLARRLGFYKLRAKVEIEPREDLAVVAGAEDAPADPRLAALGPRAVLPAGEAPPPGAAGYHATRVPLGIAEAWRDFATGEVFPHEANFDLLDGVSLIKGCYVGQEVVSRMQHRGTARKRFLPCRLEGAAAAAGTEVIGGWRVVGAAGSAAGGYQLALLRLDRIDEALSGAVPLRAGEALLYPEIPDWADLPVAPTDAAAE